MTDNVFAAQGPCQNGFLAREFLHKILPAYVLRLSYKMVTEVFIILFSFIFQHCSINSPSICTQAYVQNYFLTGTLPAEGTICPVIMPPFPPASSEDNYNDVNEGVVVGDSREKEMVFDAGEKKAENLGSDGASEILMMMDEKMKDVVVELSKAWKPFNRPLLG